MQHQLALSSEKERSSTEIATELKSKYKALEEHHKLIKNDKIKYETMAEEEIKKNKDSMQQWERYREKKIHISKRWHFVPEL